MPRSNSNGPSGRRGPSSKGKSFRKSSGESYDKPGKKSSGRSFSGESSGDKPFKKSTRRPFSEKSSGERPFKKSTGKPFSGESRGEKPFRKPGRPFSGETSGDKPFRKSSGKPFSGESRGEKPFRKPGRPFSGESSGEKPFRKSSGKSFSGESRGEKSFRKPGRPFSGESSGEKPFRKSSGRSFSGESRGEKPFRKPGRPFSGESSGDKPFRKSSGGSFSDGKKPFRAKGGSFSDDAANEKPFRKTEKRFESKPGFDKRDRDVRSSEGKQGNRRESQKANPNYSRPYKKKPFDKDSSEKHGFFNKDRGKGRSRKDFSQTTEEAPLQDKLIRLNRYIANSGVCSRREADELITMGLISVNGKVITELGYKVNPGDEVRHENRVLRAEKPVYILMNKPKGYLTTTTDPQERNTVMHIIGDAVKERIYPVGRLDRNTTGLLLFTNDGDLAEKLMHPSYNVKKIYKVELDRPLTKADFERISEGVHLEEGKAVIDDLAIISEDGRTVGIEIHIGWNRVVRRIFEALDYTVVKLDRSVYAGLDKKDLSRGHWRFLTKEEVVRLKHYSK